MITGFAETWLAPGCSRWREYASQRGFGLTPHGQPLDVVVEEDPDDFVLDMDRDDFCGCAWNDDACTHFDDVEEEEDDPWNDPHENALLMNMLHAGLDPLDMPRSQYRRSRWGQYTLRDRMQSPENVAQRRAAAAEWASVLRDLVVLLTKPESASGLLEEFPDWVPPLESVAVSSLLAASGAPSL